MRNDYEERQKMVNTLVCEILSHLPEGFKIEAGRHGYYGGRLLSFPGMEQQLEMEFVFDKYKTEMRSVQLKSVWPLYSRYFTTRTLSRIDAVSLAKKLKGDILTEVRRALAAHDQDEEASKQDTIRKKEYKVLTHRTMGRWDKEFPGVVVQEYATQEDSRSILLGSGTKGRVEMQHGRGISLSINTSTPEAMEKVLRILHTHYEEDIHETATRQGDNRAVAEEDH